MSTPYSCASFLTAIARGSALPVSHKPTACCVTFSFAGFALVTNFKRGDDCRLAVKGTGVRPKSVRIIDSELCLEETADWEIDERTGDLVLLAPVSCPSAVWLVEWKL